jgi:hypothetical protein
MRPRLLTSLSELLTGGPVPAEFLPQPHLSLLYASITEP